MTYVLTTAKLDVTGQRWVAAVALYNFKIYYRSGKLNVNVDALSRIPWDSEEIAQSCHYEPVTIQAITMKSNQIEVPEVEECLVSKAAAFFAPDYAPNMSISEWQTSQQEDGNISKILDLMEKNQLMKYKPKWEDGKEVRNYLKLRNYLTIISGILHRTVQLKHQVKPVNQLILPNRYRKRMALACHDKLGHLGMDYTLLILQDRVYWPGMARDVREHIQTCGRCEHFKQLPSVEEISQTEASYPMEIVHADFLIIGGKKDVWKDINILVVTDHFTRYAQAYVMSSQTAVTAAKTLFDEYFTHYGWPTKLVTDQGPAFESRLFQELMKKAGIRKICTTPYRSQGNAQCERFNRTLLGMLGTLPVDCKEEWQDLVAAMTHAYNCPVSKTTGLTPYFLMYGREPQLPIDVEFNLPGNRDKFNVNSYVERLLNKIDVAFQKARENIAQDTVHRKQYHDKNVHCHELKEGDIILVRRNLFDSQYKIADKWEDEPYSVVSQMDDTPVYCIKAMDNPRLLQEFFIEICYILHDLFVRMIVHKLHQVQ